jgi:hypothetical protein
LSATTATDALCKIMGHVAGDAEDPCHRHPITELARWLPWQTPAQSSVITRFNWADAQSAGSGSDVVPRAPTAATAG